MAADPTYLVCPTCGNDRFAQARRFYFLTLEGGKKQRNWAVGAEDSGELVCVRDGTLLRWNSDTQEYVVIPHHHPHLSTTSPT